MLPPRAYYDLPPSKGALRFINWGLSVCRVSFGNSFKIETWFAPGGGGVKKTLAEKMGVMLTLQVNPSSKKSVKLYFSMNFVQA